MVHTEMLRLQLRNQLRNQLLRDVEQSANTPPWQKRHLPAITPPKEKNYGPR